MEYKANIKSGIIESYCLGLLNTEESKAVEQKAQLHAGVKQEIDDFMLSLEQYAMANAVNPGKDTKKKILDLLDNLWLEETKKIDNLPLINKYTDYKNWLHIVKPLLPEKLKGEMFVQELRNDAKVFQSLIWTTVDVPDEVHNDVLESFIILEGRCRCYIEDTVTELGVGGFLEIPMYKHHNVKVLEPVLAVLQRVKVA